MISIKFWSVCCNLDWACILLCGALNSSPQIFGSRITYVGNNTILINYLISIPIYGMPWFSAYRNSSKPEEFELFINSISWLCKFYIIVYSKMKRVLDIVQTWHIVTYISNLGKYIWKWTILANSFWYLPQLTSNV